MEQTIKTVAGPYVRALDELALAMTESARAEGYTGPPFDAHWLVSAHHYLGGESSDQHRAD